MKKKSKSTEQILVGFIENKSVRNAWLSFKSIDCYMRKEFVPGRKKLIHIASVQVTTSKQGKGLFTEFLNKVELLGVDVFIENVFSERFQRFFERRGYEEFRTYEGIAKSYKKVIQ